MSAQATAVMSLKTKPEATNFEQTSRYDDVVAFLNELAKAAPRTIKLKTFGTTTEKRALPLVVVGASDPTPEAVRRTGKLRVYIQGNIHGGEVEGKESAQMLLRDLAAGRHQDWLKNMVLLVAPIYNADGNERFSITNRGRQHGPIGGQGQRPNAQGLDLNRDHMKLDSPEARAFVKLMNDYDPHVSMDLHTTNGTRHAYYLTYSPPLNPATDPTITEPAAQHLVPLDDADRSATKYGWDYYYYGNVDGGARRRRRRSAPGARSITARASTTTTSVCGTASRCSARRSPTRPSRTASRRPTASSRRTSTSSRTTLPASAASSTEADRRNVIGQRLGLRAQMAKRPELVEILMGEVTQEKHPVDGHVMDLRKDVEDPREDGGLRDLRGHRNRARPVRLLHPARTQRGGRPARATASSSLRSPERRRHVDGRRVPDRDQYAGGERLPESPRTHAHREMGRCEARGPEGTIAVR